MLLCGLGGTTRYLLKYYKPANVTGINIGEKQLQICRKNAPWLYVPPDGCDGTGLPGQFL